jgi:predicted PurR-regulated permease PerM
MSRQVTNLLKWLLLVLASSGLLYFGTMLFVPMLFGLLVAFVLYPSCLWLECRRVPVSLAIGCCLTIVSLFFILLIWVMGWQLQLFKEELPEIGQKLSAVLVHIKAAFQDHSGVTIKMQDEWIHNQVLSSGAGISGMLNRILSATTSTLFMLFLVPVYAALFLYHRKVFVDFFILLMGQENEMKLRLILQQAIVTYAGFIKGMAFVYVIVGVLNSFGLAALGIRHALLFGMLTAVMTMIPYVGIILSALLPVTMAFLTKDSLWYPLAVIGVFAFVQYLEANVIFPKVVGRQVNLSTWATLVSVIAGGIIWGVAGMVLFIPVVAILKIAARHIPGWEPLYLLLKREEEPGSGT